MPIHEESEYGLAMADVKDSIKSIQEHRGHIKVEYVDLITAAGNILRFVSNELKEAGE